MCVCMNVHIGVYMCVCEYVYWCVYRNVHIIMHVYTCTDICVYGIVHMHNLCIVMLYNHWPAFTEVT